MIINMKEPKYKIGDKLVITETRGVLEDGPYWYCFKEGTEVVVIEDDGGTKYLKERYPNENWYEVQFDETHQTVNEKFLTIDKDG